jgi:hypothetical protein
MKIFRINKNIEIVCEWKKTRNGFKHTATLMYDGKEVDSTKCCYLNRTWESYEYQSVLYRLAKKTKTLSEKEKKLLHKYIKDEGRVEDDLQPLRTVATVATLGDIFCKNKNESNDWKTRMLKAGLGNQGLEMPEDWNTLSEKEKERRLNGAIEILKK